MVIRDILLPDEYGDNASRPLAMQTFDTAFLRKPRQSGGNEPFGDWLARRGEYVVHVTGFDHASGTHNRHTVGNLLDHVHLVSDQHDGDAEFLIHSLEQRQYLGGGFRVERAGSLIREQDFRIGG